MSTERDIDIDTRLAELARLCQGSLQGRVLACLQEHRKPLSARDIAEALELPSAEGIERACHALAADGRAVVDSLGSHRRLMWRSVDAGHCDWCGIYDHHLVAGECPQCRDRVSVAHRIVRDAEQRRKEEERSA
ncbi:hypothetical protein [Sediminicurvatus halobius]|uniref:Uncharacterized protein n=1 Tax=Sediminicurvatus halobius TaxID=2182432 RepID=A0A2U2N1A4_9GAMM|nr:hypothetical protein [Spiribacter halobius]PWG62827.1 hypothetical protein DEM34_10695 [Spiribacter halobius]UEX77024.1 hypothetical protein LMH63_13860 [Spiribacter halobius]